MEMKEPWWRKFLMLTSNLVMINFVFLVFCLPIVTIGQAWCGLYRAVHFGVRGEGWFKNFWIGFKTHFIRGTIAWVLCAAACVYLAWNELAYIEMGYMPETVIHGIFLLAILMFTAGIIPLNVYLPATVSEWLINSINIISIAPIQLIAVAVMMWIPFVLAFSMLYFSILDPIFLLGIFVLGYFSLCALLATLLLRKPIVKVKEKMDALIAEVEG